MTGPPHPSSEQDELAARQIALIAAAQRQVVALSSSRTGRETHDDRQQSGLVPTNAIPGYRVLREIHRGGQGVVYHAINESTGRHVAIKLMRHGPYVGDSERVRFEREIQILGQLDHPGLVTIHDSGVAHAPGGDLHFFVMDYVRGQSLDAHIAEHCPPLRTRLELFADIAEAVNAAHLRGVIHRDLKPGNIRVDGEGRPRVLDFGLAKSSLDPAADDGSAPTITGQFIGSAPWSSPEQAEGRLDHVDVRTDVYSLGVVLFGMLTGRFPYRVDGGVRQTLDNIVRAEPSRPSNAAGSSSISVDRIDDELDTIVLRCLAKEPERRYQSAGELARDVRRYLAGEPIDAKRDSVRYLLRKQLHRHRGPVLATCLLLLLLITALIVTAGLYQSAEGHRRIAEQRLDQARQAEQRAVEEAARATRVTDLLVESFGAADPKFGGSRDLTARESLDRGAEKALNKLNADPGAQSVLLRALGSIYSHLGVYDRARELQARALELRRAHAPHDLAGIAGISTELGDSCFEAGDTDAAEKAYLAAFEIVRDRLTDHDWHVVEALVRTAKARNDTASVEPVLRAAIERLREPGQRKLLLLAALNYLGGILQDQGRHADAVPVMREALTLTNDLGGIYAEIPASVQNNLAWLLRHTGELNEARTLAEASLDYRRRTLPPEHLDVASSLFVLASIHHAAGRHADAAPMAAEAHQLRGAALPGSDYRVVEAKALIDSIAKAQQPSK